MYAIYACPEGIFAFKFVDCKFEQKFKIHISDFPGLGKDLGDPGENIQGESKWSCKKVCEALGSILNCATLSLFCG